MTSIMYLEDDSFLAESVGRYLETVGYDVAVHQRPEDGIDSMHHDRPQVLILDYDFGLMSPMTGADVAVIARSILPDTPIISFSGLDRSPEYRDANLYAEDGIYHIDKGDFGGLRDLLEALTT